jgi:hypothetical protein
VTWLLGSWCSGYVVVAASAWAVLVVWLCGLSIVGSILGSTQRMARSPADVHEDAEEPDAGHELEEHAEDLEQLDEDAELDDPDQPACSTPSRPTPSMSPNHTAG